MSLSAVSSSSSSNEAHTAVQCGIEKYGFICVEFGNPHPCVQSPSHAIVAAEYEGSADKKNQGGTERMSLALLAFITRN